MTAPVDPTAWDAFVEASDPGPTCSWRPGPRVKAVNGWSAHRLHGSPSIGAQVLVRRPRPLPWGFAYAPRGPVARSWSAEEIAAFTERVRSDLSDAAGRVSHLRIDPEIELDGPLDPDGALRRALRGAGWRPAPPIQPASTRLIDLRPDEAALCGATSGRSGASTSTRRDRRASWWWTRTATGSASSTGSTARRRTAPGSSSGPSRPTATSGRPIGRPVGPAALRAVARWRAAGHPVPRPQRAPRGRAVRRHDPGRRRHPRQLPAQVGSHPDVPGAGRDELRPVGPRDRGHRPLQDRASGAARCATSGRGTSFSTRSDEGLRGRRPSARVVGAPAQVAGGGNASAAGAQGACRGDRSERPVRGCTRATAPAAIRRGRLGPPRGARPRRPRLPVPNVGRPARASRLAAASCRSMTTGTRPWC